MAILGGEGGSSPDDVMLVASIIQNHHLPKVSASSLTRLQFSSKTLILAYFRYASLGLFINRALVSKWASASILQAYLTYSRRLVNWEHAPKSCSISRRTLKFWTNKLIWYCFMYWNTPVQQNGQLKVKSFLNILPLN